MAWRLFGAKSLHEPIDIVMLLIGSPGRKVSEIVIKIQLCSFKRMNLSSENVDHFVSVPICWNINTVRQSKCF